MVKVNNPHWKNKHLREKKVLDLVRNRTTIPLPKVIAAFSHPTDWHQNVLIYQKLPGITLRDHLEQQSLSVKEILAIMKQLGQFLQQLHQITFPFFGDFLTDSVIMESSIGSPFWGKQFHSWSDCFQALCFDNLTWVDTTSFPSLRPVLKEKTSEFTARLSSPTVGHLIHSDIQPTNILIAHKAISGILDWEWCYSGVPALEIELIKMGFGYSLFPSLQKSRLFNSFGREFHQQLLYAFFEGYALNGSSLPSYSFPSDIAQFLWLLYVIGSWKWIKEVVSSATIRKLQTRVNELFRYFCH
jgi:serine/threonine protein kinase